MVFPLRVGVVRPPSDASSEEGQMQTLLSATEGKLLLAHFIDATRLYIACAGHNEYIYPFGLYTYAFVAWLRNLNSGPFIWLKHNILLRVFCIKALDTHKGRGHDASPKGRQRAAKETLFFEQCIFKHKIFEFLQTFKSITSDADLKCVVTKHT